MPLTNETSSIDEVKLLDRCMGNSALLGKLIQAFSNSLPTEKNILQKAIDDNDMNSVARTAHKLKGTASNMCALGLAEASHLVEQSARSNQVELIPQQWLNLRLQIDTVIECILSKDSER